MRRRAGWVRTVAHSTLARRSHPGTHVAAPLDRTLQREVLVAGEPWTVTLTPQGVRLVPKGKRTGGHEVTWEQLASGQVELTAALERSVTERAMLPSPGATIVRLPRAPRGRPTHH